METIESLIPRELLAENAHPSVQPNAFDDASRSILRAQRQRDNEKRWSDACPIRLQETDWTHPNLTPYAAQSSRVMAYQIARKGVMASGPTGRGKSRAMWQLMRRLGVVEGHDARYWNAQDWFFALQQNIRYGNDEARGWVETVARRHVVFIDDFGQEAVQTAREDWANGWFFRFLDIRVGAGLPLFITTNLTAREMAAQQTKIRANPLIRRLLDLCEPVRFE